MRGAFNKIYNKRGIINDTDLLKFIIKNVNFIQNEIFLIIRVKNLKILNLSQIKIVSIHLEKVSSFLPLFTNSSHY